ncbi:MAG: murein biosynthesis integral membrane protein MurJ, partial [Bifidobacterium mongoliense]|nr:murein biosynthesis integral membrane protein MurJ [Bifidobacterium mongoliense]
MSSSVGRNSLIMATGTAASRLTGQIRTILLAAAVGTTGLAANAYQAGAMIPQVVFTLVSGGIFNAVLVPQIVRTFKQEGAERKLNKLITFAVTLLLGMTLLMSAASPLLTRLYTDSGPDMTALTNAFTLWCMPQILF